MKYKVGDRVNIFEKVRNATIIMLDGSTTLVRFENGQKEWVSTELIHQCYRAMYEQEKALREAAEAIIVEFGTQRLKEAHKHYQQLKQQYNGQDTGITQKYN